MWKIVYTPQANKDARKIKEAGLKLKVHGLLEVLEKNPFQTPPYLKNYKEICSGFILVELIVSIDLFIR